MSTASEFDSWSAGQSYDLYMGRWSRRVAARFVEWLTPPGDAAWLDIGCGTGALTETILAGCAPRSIVSIDPSQEFVAEARSRIADPRVRFEVASAQQLPSDDARIDVVASALVLNFVQDRPAAFAEMRRVLRPGGLLSFYVWDYPGGGVGFIDAFWKAAEKIDPQAAALDEGRRFPFCTRDGLAAICADAGLGAASIEAIEVDTPFTDFEALWLPFTLGAGPAPGYCIKLPADQREALKAYLHEALGDGPLRLTARAWAVRARV